MIINKMAFFIHDLELINHFSCLWELLPQGTFDIIYHHAYLSKEDAVVFNRYNCQVVSAENLIQKNIKYQYLVSNHPIDANIIKQLANFNIRFMYAAGKINWNLATWNNLYDVILCFGPYHAAAFTNNTKAIVIQMGYPRFDKYFNFPTSRAILLSRYNCDPLKKTVVWLPTWKEISSVGYFDKEISALTKNYNVIVKLHPMMKNDEPQRVTVLMQHYFTKVITDASDNVPLYQLADFMLFDYGGPPFAGIYTNKHFVLLNVEGAAKNNLTGQNSPDVFIHKHLINVNAEDGNIAGILENMTLLREQAVICNSLKNIFFAPYFGFASQIAAKILLHLDYIIANR